jgi:hypothetical protein
MPISNPHVSSLGKPFNHIMYMQLIHLTQSSDIAGPSSLEHRRQIMEDAIPRPFPGKGEWYIEVPEKPK